MGAGVGVVLPGNGMTGIVGIGMPGAIVGMGVRLPGCGMGRPGIIVGIGWPGAIVGIGPPGNCGKPVGMMPYWPPGTFA